MANDLCTWFNETRYYVPGFDANIWMSIRKSTVVARSRGYDRARNTIYMITQYLKLLIRTEYKIVYAVTNCLANNVVHENQTLTVLAGVVIVFPSLRWRSDRSLLISRARKDVVTKFFRADRPPLCLSRPVPADKCHRWRKEKGGKNKQHGTRCRVSHYFKWLQRQPGVYMRTIYHHLPLSPVVSYNRVVRQTTPYGEWVYYRCRRRRRRRRHSSRLMHALLRYAHLKLPSY